VGEMIKHRQPANVSYLNTWFGQGVLLAFTYQWYIYVTSSALD